jgi:hypothetical protein
MPCGARGFGRFVGGYFGAALEAAGGEVCDARA